MRKHGWQLPYHPLQVVAVAVFLALGFAFYVFFAPFVGKQLYQYIAYGLYTPLITCAFSLYTWCAAADPADPGVFRSKKYLNIAEDAKPDRSKDSKRGGDSTPSPQGANAATLGRSPKDVKPTEDEANACSSALLALVPCAALCSCSSANDDSSQQQMSEDGMFYCSLCEVEVYKYSKHCRVCDKCVNHFDHHCRWLNNCIGKKNYRQFFALMVFSLLLLILQWCTGILVMTCCFIDRKRYSVDIADKLGSSFSLVPFVIVVAVCTVLAMTATLPLAQLFFFHILLIKKGISTYDYIIALREQEQQVVGGQQSPQMSPASSVTGLSSTSSFANFNRARGAWCTPPRLLLEDQFDVVPPDTGSVSSLGKKMPHEEVSRKKSAGTVKISPWALARLNAEDVSKAAAEARMKSKILQPVTRHGAASLQDTDSSFDGSRRRMIARLDNNRRRASKRVRLPAELPVDTLARSLSQSGVRNVNQLIAEPSTSLAPLQLEARSAFRTSLAMSNESGPGPGPLAVASSPDSSLTSPDIHPFRVSSSGPEEMRRLTGLPTSGGPGQIGFPLSRSTSDGYDASGGEDSDQLPPARIVNRPTDWSNLLFNSNQDVRLTKLKAPSSSGQSDPRQF
uniref:S-acyltransferase n=2 Tax=Kalanchoe fedtschenkoi TaxID=63787 RepID=A0A7N0UL60_KALFE